MEQSLLFYYQAIEDSSRKMLEAAKAADWDAVALCEAESAVLIEQLRYCARQEKLDGDARKAKGEIMRRILQNDAQIRYLAEPWLAHCAQEMQQGQFLH